MLTSKCHNCGYYFSGSSLNACPRCSQGFSGPIDEHFASGNSGELGRGIQSKGARIGAIIMAGVLIGSVLALSHNGNSGGGQPTNYSSDSANAGTDQTAPATDSSSNWYPDGYVVFSANPEIAYEDGYNGGSCNNPNSNNGTGYCWNYQIVTKASCQVVSATVDLTNGDTNIGQASGEVNNTTAREPIRIEIDAYDNADVNDSTSASMSAITCTA